MVRIIPPGGRRPKSSRGRQTIERRQGRVIDLAGDGRGVVRLDDGRVVLVPRVWPGEKVEVRVGPDSNARLEQLVQPAPERRPPPCEHFVRCGGCPWQMVSEGAQAEAKQQRVARIAEQLGLGVLPRPLWRSPLVWGYRNRAQLKTDGQRLGFMALDGTSLVDVNTCPVLNPGAAMALAELRQALPAPHWRGRGGALRTWHVDDRLPPRLDSRQPFRQGNSEQNTRMRQWLFDRCVAPGPGAVLELFAGSGNFTEVLSRARVPVLAVEVVAEALETAPPLPNVEWWAADLYQPEALAPLATKAAHCTDLVLDPPRAGFPGLGKLAAALPALERIFYISCDPATFTRDAAALLPLGWECRELQPVDLFPQTPHVELLCEFARR